MNQKENLDDYYIFYNICFLFILRMVKTVTSESYKVNAALFLVFQKYSLGRKINSHDITLKSGIEQILKNFVLN